MVQLKSFTLQRSKEDIMDIQNMTREQLITALTKAEETIKDLQAQINGDIVNIFYLDENHPTLGYYTIEQAHQGGPYFWSSIEPGEEDYTNGETYPTRAAALLSAAENAEEEVVHPWGDKVAKELRNEATRASAA